MTLVNFPTIITASLATSLVPSIAEAYALQEATQIKRRTQTGLRLTILISLPAAVGLYVLAEPLTTIIFAVPTAARILRITAWSVVFIGLQETSSAILNGMGRTRIPARNLFVGALVNAFFNYTLTANPRFGIRGAAFGTVFGFAVAALLNLIYVKRYTEFKIDIRALVFKPAIAVTIMGIAVKQAFAILNTLFSLFTAYHYVIATFLAVLVGIVAYVLLLFITREIKYNDLLMIPGVGEKIARILKKSVW
ncbi:MAG TPA: polysaccharide biosynthesis C-terminal domain-containing protein, partial [Halanaerobiales bacterium]|nr:polysaccharide biosynthesis C-terminal domain-containing protein [Halanaerobiales bacterium]